MGQPLKLYYTDQEGKDQKLHFREAHLLPIAEMKYILEEIKFYKGENMIRFREIFLKMLLKEEEVESIVGLSLSNQFHEEFHRFLKPCQGYPKYEGENIGLIYQEGDREERMTWNSIINSKENLQRAQGLLKSPEVLPLRTMKMIIDDELSRSRKRYGPEFKPIHENVSEHHEGLGYEGWTRFHEGPINFVTA